MTNDKTQNAGVATDSAQAAGSVINTRGHADWMAVRICEWCGHKFRSGQSSEGGRPPKFCSDAHRMMAYRKRKTALRNAGSTTPNAELSFEKGEL